MNNKNFKIKVLDIILLPLLLLPFFFSSLSEKNINGMSQSFNINKTNVDYIVQTPSSDQVKEMRKLSHIDEVTPYIYSKSNSNINNKVIKTDLYIVKDDLALKNSLFSDDLLENYVEVDKNSIFIDENFSRINKVSLGDKIKIDVFSEKIEFNVSRIYKSDSRHSAGMLMCLNEGSIKTALDKKYSNGYKFNGAFIKSNNLIDTENYLKTYKPYGNMFTREDFTSDELYQKYLEEFNSTDHTLNIFYRNRFLKDKHNTYDDRINAARVLTIILPICSVILTLAYASIRTLRYSKTELKKDIKNNFNFKTESPMFVKWLVIFSVADILFSLIYSAISYFAFNVGFASLNNIIMLGLTIVSLCVFIMIFLGTLKNKFKKVK